MRWPAPGRTRNCARSIRAAIRSISAGGAREVINALGTPVHALVKGASCVATGVVAVPLASAFQITGSPQDRGLQQDTYKTVGRTCGGSYVLGAPHDDLPPSR